MRVVGASGGMGRARRLVNRDVRRDDHGVRVRVALWRLGGAGRRPLWEREGGPRVRAELSNPGHATALPRGIRQ